ncbi:MAG TPA: ABC transporter substrate-binding protein [Xanthobacteraceae bacterium]|jgi:ABC-type nitrate/sulfonate/bicarbonate transport system substrate-binding protein|nr:ABC transporter substrate-binding protein [Xanthobacteraceae bacterium]
MPRPCSLFSLRALFAILAGALVAGLGTPSVAQTAPNCTGGLRKVNVGVAVAPPNVVHTAPYVAKALGFFAKHCVDANIIQFDGGAAGTSVTAVGQGSAVSNLPDTAIAQGLRGRQIWGLAPRPPQAYAVTAEIKTAADLKGKRLSAAGGVGGLNWLIGRAALRSGGLTVDDAQFISQGTAGRLPGFIAGQIDAVALHPEDLYIAQQRKPGTHVLAMLSDLWPKYSFNAYGAAESLIAKDHDLLRDTVAAMIEANRAVYRDKEKVIPVIVEATQKPREAVEFAVGVLTKNCVLSVNTGFVRERTEWTHQNNIDIGDIPPEKKLSFDQIADHKLAEEAVASLGGPVTIDGCKD